MFYGDTSVVVAEVSTQFTDVEFIGNDDYVDIVVYVIDLEVGEFIIVVVVLQ